MTSGKKLTEEKISEVRNLFMNGTSRYEIAKITGIDYTVVSDILARRKRFKRIL